MPLSSRVVECPDAEKRGDTGFSAAISAAISAAVFVAALYKLNCFKADYLPTVNEVART